MQPKRQDTKIPKIFLTLLNQLFEIETKIKNDDDSKKICRNIERMKDELRSGLDPLLPELGYSYEDPLGQLYDETRNDLDAHIVGESTKNLIVIDVIKPIIRISDSKRGISKVVQRGIVSVKSEDKYIGEEND